MSNKPDVITTYITKREIEKRVKQLGDEISKNYAGEDVIIVCVLKGSFIFCADLIRNIRDVNLNVEFVQLSSYEDATESSGNVKVTKHLSLYGSDSRDRDNLRDTHILVVEDIVDTGQTLGLLMSMLNNYETKSLKLCALLNKPSRRIDQRVQLDYIGFTIPDVFVVGYGLDKAQRHRGLRFIGRIEETRIGRILSPIKNFVTHVAR